MKFLFFFLTVCCLGQIVYAVQCPYLSGSGMTLDCSWIFQQYCCNNPDLGVSKCCFDDQWCNATSNYECMYIPSSSRSPSKTSTASRTPSGTPTNTPTNSKSPSFSRSPSKSLSPTASQTSSNTPSISIGASYSSTQTSSPSLTISVTSSLSPSSSPSFTPTPSITPSSTPSQSSYPTRSNYPTRPPVESVAPADIIDVLNNQTKVIYSDGDIVIDSKVTISQPVISQANLILTNTSTVKFVETEAIVINGTLTMGGLVKIYLDEPLVVDEDRIIFEASEGIELEDPEIEVREAYQTSDCSSVRSSSRLSENKKSFHVLLSPVQNECSSKSSKNNNQTFMFLFIGVICGCSVLVVIIVSTLVVMKLFGYGYQIFHSVDKEDKRMAKEIRNKKRSSRTSRSSPNNPSPTSSISIVPRDSSSGTPTGSDESV